MNNLYRIKPIKAPNVLRIKSSISVRLFYKNKKQEIHISKVYYGIAAVFSIYIIAVFHFTGTGTLYDGFLYELELKQEQLNFVPFSNDIDITAYLQNILLFVPFGFLIPLIHNLLFI